MWDKIRKAYWNINIWAWFVALIGLAIVLVGNNVMPDSAAIGTVISIFNYVMYLFTVIVAVMLVVMVIRTIIVFRPIGFLWIVLLLAVTALLYLTYFSLAGVINIF